MREDNKGAYRSVYCSIWDDPEFQSFSPGAQLIFFNLRTNRDCNYPCIYTFYKTTLEERIPGMSRENLASGWDELERSGWIRYERPILWIVKGLQNEPTFVPGNENHRLGVDNILKSLPKLRILEEFREYYGDTLRIPSGYPTPYPPDQGKGEGEGKGEGKGEGEGEAISCPAGNAPPGLFPGIPEKKSGIPHQAIVEHLNALIGAHFRFTSPTTQRLIRARWKEGYRMSDFLQVIEKKVAEWKNDDDRRQYLRPKTLFGTNFESYLNAPARRKGKVTEIGSRSADALKRWGEKTKPLEKGENE
jgi:uncharacterized phage protein (TIGR02220 family)